VSTRRSVAPLSTKIRRLRLGVEDQYLAGVDRDPDSSRGAVVGDPDRMVRSDDLEDLEIARG